MASRNENNLKRSVDETDGKNNDNDINESKLPEQSEKNNNIDDKKKKKIETSDTRGDSPNSSFDTSKRIGDLIMGKPLDNPIQLQLKSTNKNAKSSMEKGENPKTGDTGTCGGKESTKKEINKTQSNTIHNNTNEKNSLKKNITSFDDANKKIYNEKKDPTELKGEQKSVSDSFRKFDNQGEVTNRENGNYSRNNSATPDEHEKKMEPTQPKSNDSHKIKNVNDFLAEKKNSKKITVFVGEKVQKVKADFKYGEDAPRNENQKTVYESENVSQNCIDDSQGNENRVIEKKQRKTVFVAQRCERSNADARAGEELVKKVPEKTVFEAQRCEKSNADARAGEAVVKKYPAKTVFEAQRCEKSNADARAGEAIAKKYPAKTVFEAQRCEKSNADARAGEAVAKKYPEKTVFEAQRCEKSNADARAGEAVAKKYPEKTVFEAQRCEKSNADARAGEALVKKYPEKTVFEAQICEKSNADARAGDKLKETSTGKVIYESQKCNKVITDYRATDKIKEVMKRNLLDECHNI
ncbi:conserved Plasmodium protein, unknown function [Plasmodium vinckei lentum]|uniref:Uncharacterized protein n=1 Tax=Plasmodium vinckei lentum TaxID=138297 RepID=A0A6V7S1C9_PLAVN|nr:conserved Plasmodium protein, unknown function [Plasmodium vinckei lentum]